MSSHENLQRVLDSGIVAVIRADSGETLADVAEALLAGGVEVMEVTFTVPDAVEVIKEVKRRIGDRILLGAGTVLDSETARTAILAGAEFIVSPSTDVKVIEMCKRYDKIVTPGVFTPTEVVTAWQAGADIVKVFPADIGGPSHLKALKGPLPQVKIMPTGGVDLTTAEDFLKAGACALGVGGALGEKDAVERGDMDRITSLAKQYVEIVRNFRSQSGD
ncbi:MAG: bifunctional 2-keto-4-hydroxyglutarate aldolase/2-keto-3-deoxy-6-phosphogluconate aldolase [Pirellulales bacterium]|nr:bifunctional 2-keto-4-hydroxyglutarate aldolase/2-keto-3-deoxy-6-phosphogluconate aldolase [Pirellulales bacterium]